MGTSLKVRPIKTMVVDFPANVPQIWINKERFSGTNSDMPGVQVDIELLGECDIVVEELCRRAGWGLEEFMWLGSNENNGMSQSRAHKQVNNEIPIRKIPHLKSESKEESKPDMTSSQHTIAHDSDNPKTTTTNSITENNSPSPTTLPTNPPPYTVKTTCDLDAEWRWRFTKTENH